MQYIFLLLTLSFLFPCNIGVAYDANNIPVIWKNRDISICNDQECIDSHDEDPNLSGNRASWLYMRNNNGNDILSISTADKKSRYIGMNNKGFAVVNSVVENDVEDDDIDEGDEDDICTTSKLISMALLDSEIERVEDFYSYLQTLQCHDPTEIISANFAVLDSYGDGGMYEFYMVGDAADGGDASRNIHQTLLAESNRYIVRTNHFRELTQGPPPESSSIKRYNKADSLMTVMISDFDFYDLFSFEKFQNDPHELPLLRHFSDANGYDYSIPYSSEPGYNIPIGYFSTKVSINRAKTISSVVIKGKDPNQDGGESVMWANLGNPITSPYLPLKITDFIDENDDWIENSFVYQDYNPEDPASAFSIAAHEIREKMIDFSEDGSLFDRCINSYLIENISEKIYELESNLIDNYLDPNFDINDFALDVIEEMELFYTTFNTCNGDIEADIGDINCNQQVDLSDLIIIIGYINSYFEFTTTQETIADYNQDSIVDILDIVLIVSFILAN